MAATGGYRFKPHERPFMAGSPANPDHPTRRRILYFLIGVLIGITAGFSNALLIANLPQIRGSLGVTPVEGGWLVAAYSMTNVCMSMLLIKIRQQFGMRLFTRIFLVAFVCLNLLQLFSQSYAVELAARAASGIIGSGLTVLGIFYVIQSMPAKARLGGLVIGIGITQIAMPLARFVSPILLWNGEIQNLFLLELGLALAVFGAVSLLPLPPSETARAFEKIDLFTFVLFAPGVALLSAVLVQGPIVWWSTPWIGYALAASLLLIGAALLIEHNRVNPMLNTRWFGSGAIVRFAVLAASMRVLLSEQSYGTTGLMTMLGMGNDQLVILYGLAVLAALAGLIASFVTLDPADLLKPVLFSLALIAIAAFMDSRATNLTRPMNLYFSHALIAFATIYFMGPVMMTGLFNALSKGPTHIVSFAAVFSIAQTLGGLGGAALLGSIQSLRQKFHSSQLVESVVMSDSLVVERLRRLEGMLNPAIVDPAQLRVQAGSMLQKLVSQEAHVLAYNDVFLLVAVFALVALVGLGGQWTYYRVNGINPLGPALAALQKKRMEDTQ